jgi:hypothetical protein
MICIEGDERSKRKAGLTDNPVGPCLLKCSPGKRPKLGIGAFPSQMTTRLALMQPHLQQTKDQAHFSPVVLLVQDTIDIDLLHDRHPSAGWGADIFPFLQMCQATQTPFLLQSGKSRRVEVCEQAITSSLDLARSWPSQASCPFAVPARHAHQGRSTQLQLAFGQITLLPPRNTPRVSKDPLTVWVIRVWEEQTPEGEEPLEWVRHASVPTTRLEQAWEGADCYRHRGLVEEYHQCLKSVYRMEERHLQTGDGLLRLLGLLSLLAVRLLQVRAYAREDPARPASEVIAPLMLAVVAERSGHSPASMTVAI